MIDFTPEKYRSLLEALQRHGRFTVRHDVDLRPDYALRIARIEAAMGMASTYYFRTVLESFDIDIIQEIASLGHNIGYHYECLTTCDGDIDAAYQDFIRNLNRLRMLAPVTTACAHGSPRSKWNSMDIWGKYDIHALGITYEPMMDTDFSTTLYLTDTGGRWDGFRVSVRDKVPQYQKKWEKMGLTFHTTGKIIHALNTDNHPINQYNLLINTHPQRWIPFSLKWIQETLLQKGKNIVKRIIVSTR